MRAAAGIGCCEWLIFCACVGGALVMPVAVAAFVHGIGSKLPNGETQFVSEVNIGVAESSRSLDSSSD